MRLCRLLLVVFALFWAIAFFLLLVGTFGWFGQPLDPLSGVFLVFLGVPWSLAPISYGAVIGALLPGLNLVLLFLLCRWLGRRQ